MMPIKHYRSMEELPIMMSVEDVAAVLGISRSGAYALAHDRTDGFPAFKVGKRILVHRDAFQEWIREKMEW